MAFSEELYEYIRRLTVDETNVRALKLRAQALLQGARDAWAPGAGTGFSAATLQGHVFGCDSNALPSATVEVLDHATGEVLTTVTADSSGFYSGTVFIQGSSATIDLLATATGAGLLSGRFAPTLHSSVGISAGSNTMPTFAIGPASGYTCLTGWGTPYPVPSNGMIVVDSMFTGGTMTALAATNSPFTISYGGCPGPWTNQTITWRIGNSKTATAGWGPGGPCSNNPVNFTSGLVTSLSLPNPSTGAGLDVTWTLPVSGGFACGGACMYGSSTSPITLRIHE